MCSNISTDTMRSKAAGEAWKSFMSAVMTVRLVKPRAAAWDWMYSRCPLEFDTAVMREPG